MHNDHSLVRIPLGIESAATAFRGGRSDSEWGGVGDCTTSIYHNQSPLSYVYLVSLMVLVLCLTATT